MPRSLRWLSAVLILAPLAVACGMAEDNLAVVANAPGTFAVGEPQRLMVGLVDTRPTTSWHHPISPPKPSSPAPTNKRPRWTPNSCGRFPTWSASMCCGRLSTRRAHGGSGSNRTGLGPTPKAAFTVSTDDRVPGVGDVAPAVATRTLDGHPLEEISSDDDPDPNFYQLSLDEALQNGRPTVVVFATPAFCVSQTCGPMLDQVKAVAPAHPNANFLHVEIYENLDATSADDLIIDPAVAAWGLPSEPWVFVVDGNGVVAARFEGAMTTAEIESALEQVGA